MPLMSPFVFGFSLFLGFQLVFVLAPVCDSFSFLEVQVVLLPPCILEFLGKVNDVAILVVGTP